VADGHLVDWLSWSSSDTARGVVVRLNKVEVSRASLHRRRNCARTATPVTVRSGLVPKSLTGRTSSRRSFGG